jgi:hypothetical protein
MLICGTIINKSYDFKMIRFDIKTDRGAFMYSLCPLSYANFCVGDKVYMKGNTILVVYE